MTLEEKLRKLIIEERQQHQGSNTDLAFGRETILKELERLLEQEKSESKEIDLLLS